MPPRGLRGDGLLTRARAAGLAGVMTEPTPDAWRRVDAYLTETLVGHDPDLETAVAEQNAAGLPADRGRAGHGQAAAPARPHLRRAARARDRHARRLLDDLDGARHPRRRQRRHDRGRAAQSPRSPAPNLDRAGVGDKVEIRIGRGGDVLPTLEGEEPFDLVFIDADKESNTIYLDWAARLGHPGTVVVVDNVGRGGEVANPATIESAGDRHAARARAARAATRASTRPRCRRSISKGWDGVAIALVV